MFCACHALYERMSGSVKYIHYMAFSISPSRFNFNPDSIKRHAQHLLSQHAIALLGLGSSTLANKYYSTMAIVCHLHVSLKLDHSAHSNNV